MNERNSKTATDRPWRIDALSKDAQRYRQNGWWRNRSHVDDFLECVKTRPDKVAIAAYSDGVPDPYKLTYGELHRHVEQCSRAFLALGVEPGDVISLQLPNSWEFPILALAALRVGAIPNPIPIIYREREVSFMLRHAASKVFVAPAAFRGFSFAEMARKLEQDIPTLKHVITTGAPVSGLSNFNETCLNERRSESFTDGESAPPRSWINRLLGRNRNATDEASELERRRPRANDLAVLLYTSGTTGVPKAAMHSHNTLWSSCRAVDVSLKLTSDDVVFMASTMGHLTGFYWGMLLPLSTGQKVVYQDVWSADGMLDAIEREGVTWTLSATPFALDLVDAQKREKREVTSFRAFVCGGAAIPPAVSIALEEHLSVSLISLWGCTEVGICTIHKLGAPVDILANSDGMPVEWMELRIVDDKLKPVASGQEGQLHVRGPSTFVGYFKQSDLTEDMRTEDGWYDTGDLGRRTDDGGVRITGRSKDIIIRGGQNIPVVEIENELLKHPRIKEVVVVGVPDERLGERGCAVVVPVGEAPSLDDLRACLESNGMAKQFWPEQLEVIDAMPRTPAGKVQKYVLRKRIADAQNEHV